jgi:hypothetical protein
MASRKMDEENKITWGEPIPTTGPWWQQFRPRRGACQPFEARPGVPIGHQRGATLCGEEGEFYGGNVTRDYAATIPAPSAQRSYGETGALARDRVEPRRFVDALWSFYGALTTLTQGHWHSLLLFGSRAKAREKKRRSSCYHACLQKPKRDARRVVLGLA